MFHADALSFSEFAMSDPLPISTIHGAILEFLRYRNDVALFGAQAVNAYVPEPRMTQDVDVMSVRAEALADELRHFLNERFHIATRVREIGEGRGFRVYQNRKEGNRHLVDIRPVAELPKICSISDIPVVAPEELIALKVISLHNRQNQPKAGTDWRDVAMLLLTFPDLKSDPGPVTERLIHSGADTEILKKWRELAASEIQHPDDDDI